MFEGYIISLTISLALVVVTLLKLFVQIRGYFYGDMMGLIVRIITTSAIYQKVWVFSFQPTNRGGEKV